MPKVTIEKLIFGGQGLGRVGDKVAFVWGALPGEEVEFEVTKEKKNFMEGMVANILTRSPYRIDPVDDHYQSCSPWQIIEYAEENAWKVKIAEETYGRIAGLTDLKLDITAPEMQYDYRNKMEYNFFIDDRGKISFAFHTRGTHYLQPIDDCALASPAIQEAGHTLLQWLNSEQIPPGILKSTIIRSNSRGETIIALFLKQQFNFSTQVVLDKKLLGFLIFYSDFRSPASVPTELLYITGQDFLQEELMGVNLRFGSLSFFQINIPLFAEVLEDISHFIERGEVVDFYAGVGSISLPLFAKYTRAVLVEESKEAVMFAEENIKENKITNAKIVRAMSEEALEYITREATVILDPPRTGLHKKVVERLLAVKPKRIIYLSCGIDTHARDIGMLLPHYRPICWKLYNFFPRTPHIEGLCVLECM